MTWNSVDLWHGNPPLLQHLDIELTERCNNNCIHCYINLPANDERTRRRELTTEQVKGVLREAADLGALSVRFTGGEPLLRNDFANLYAFSRQLGLKVVLFTNARCITPELADLFARIPPLEKIEVSVYGMKKESYEAVSKTRGSYEEFRRGVDLLLTRRIPFVVKGALLPPVRSEISEFDSWASTLPGMEFRPAHSMFFDLRARRDSPAKNHLIQQLRVSPEEGVAIMARQRVFYDEQLARFCSRLVGPPGDRLFGCGAGLGICVDAYGKVQACGLLRHPDTVYDLGGGSLANALTDFFPRLRERRAENPSYLERCAKCFLKGLCEQCPGKSWTEHGTLDTPVDYVCRVAHAQARDLGLLGEHENGWQVVDWRERIGRFAEPRQP